MSRRPPRISTSSTRRGRLNWSLLTTPRATSACEQRLTGKRLTFCWAFLIIRTALVDRLGVLPTETGPQIGRIVSPLRGIVRLDKIPHDDNSARPVRRAPACHSRDHRRGGAD